MSMSIKTFLNVAKRLPVENSVLLRGPHGIGKSQVVRQVAKHFNLEVVDRRLSQMTEGDMVGLPSTDGEVTRFNPPDWYKDCCLHARCLLLDELNRATPEVMQAGFQVVLDRELNGWKLHPETRVFAAVNTGGSYTVNEMDPALIDRFHVVDLEPTVEDLLEHARATGCMHDTVIDFLASNHRWVDPDPKLEAHKKQPSRRSWEKLSKSLCFAGLMETPQDPLFYSMCLGFIGAEATIAFHGFAVTMDAQVTGEEVLRDYAKCKKKVAKLGQEKQNILIEKVADHILRDLKTLDDKQGMNLRNFVKDLPGELRVAAWTKLSGGNNAEGTEMAKAIHRWCVEAVLEVFGVTADAAVKALTAVGGTEATPPPAEEKKKGRGPRSK